MKIKALMLALATLVATAPGARAASFQLEYSVSVQNVISLGRMTLNAAFGQTNYAASATVRTADLAAIFDNTRIAANASGGYSAGRIRWGRYDLDHSYAKKRRRTVMARGGAAQVTPRFTDMGSPPATPEQIAASSDPVSTFTAMGLAIAQSKRCGGRYLVFDGRQHYALNLSPKSGGRYAGGGYTGQAIVCNLRYEPISGFSKRESGRRSPIPTAEIWFAAEKNSGFAFPLRIAVPTPVGEGRIDLAKVAIRA